MSAVTPPTPDYLEQLLQDIDFIGEVEPNHKLCVSTRSYANRDDWRHSVSRYWYGETGLKNAQFINGVVRGLCQAIDGCTDPRYLQTLYTAALRLRAGIKRLIITYTGYPGTLAVLRTSCMTLELKLPDSIKARYGIALHDGSIGISPPAQNDYNDPPDSE